MPTDQMASTDQLRRPLANTTLLVLKTVRRALSLTSPPCAFPWTFTP